MITTNRQNVPNCSKLNREVTNMLSGPIGRYHATKWEVNLHVCEHAFKISSV